MKKLKLLFVTVCLISSANLWADSSPIPACDNSNHHYSLGTDLAPYAMNGYSLLTSSLAGNCRFTMELWQLDLPEAFIDLNNQNKGEGWSRKLNGFTIYLDTFYGPKDENWYSGIVLGTFKSTVSKKDFIGSQSFRSYELLLRFGYKWNITNSLSIEPWFAAGPILSDSKEPSYGGDKFEESKIQVLSTIHLSYKFFGN